MFKTSYQKSYPIIPPKGGRMIDSYLITINLSRMVAIIILLCPVSLCLDRRNTTETQNSRFERPP